AAPGVQPTAAHTSGAAQALGQGAGQLGAQRVDGQLRVGTDAGGEQRTIVDRQVFQLVVAAEAVAHAQAWVFAHRATAHHVGAAQLGAVQRQVEAVDQFAGGRQVVDVVGIRVQRQYGLGTSGKLDFRHAVIGAADAVPGVVGQRVVEHRA